MYLSHFPIKAIFTSPLLRCRQTAAIIANCQSGKVNIKTENRLAELYDERRRDENGKLGESLLSELVKQASGEQIVAVTHQFLIRYIMEDFYHSNNPFGHLPECGELYRLVFADVCLVDIALLNPPLSNAVPGEKSR